MTELAELAEPVMSLSKRQRAMLKEMGVQVWQPLAKTQAVTIEAIRAAAPAASAPPAEVIAASNAINSGASRARIQRPADTFDTKNQPFHPPKGAAERPAANPDVNANRSANANPGVNAWRIGKLQTLYAASAPDTGARWLILIESPASALQESFDPFEGEAGKLLDNMLRAAKLHTAGAAMLAPLVRGHGTGGDLAGDLADIFTSAQANVVLVMGRLAAQALLQSTEPLARLRGQIHSLHSTQTIITIDPAYLLRNPLDKAKAWDDLCLAISLAKAS